MALALFLFLAFIALLSISLDTSAYLDVLLFGTVTFIVIIIIMIILAYLLDALGFRKKEQKK